MSTDTTPHADPMSFSDIAAELPPSQPDDRLSRRIELRRTTTECLLGQLEETDIPLRELFRLMTATPGIRGLARSAMETYRNTRRLPAVIASMEQQARGTFSPVLILVALELTNWNELAVTVTRDHRNEHGTLENRLMVVDHPIDFRKQ